MLGTKAAADMELHSHSLTRKASSIAVKNKIASDKAIRIPGTFDAFSSSLAYRKIQRGPSAPVYPDDDNGEVRGTIRDLAQALASFAATNKWVERTENPRHWKSGAVEVTVGSGSGQSRTSFSLSLTDFVGYCIDTGFSTSFLHRLAGKASLFEHQLSFTLAGDRLSYLELAMATYEIDAFFLLLRIDYHKRSTKALIFLKLQDSLGDIANNILLDVFIYSLE